jgi:ketosteroid isomerase-like protein
MSQENVEIVRRAFRAFQGRDSKAWVNCFHSEALEAVGLSE